MTDYEREEGTMLMIELRKLGEDATLESTIADWRYYSDIFWAAGWMGVGTWETPQRAAIDLLKFMETDK